MAKTRLEKAFRRLKIDDPSAESVSRELGALGIPALDAALVEFALAPAAPDESFASGRRAVDALVPAGYPAEARPFVVAAIARRRTARAVHQAADALLASAPDRLDRVFADAYRAIFESRLLPLRDSSLTGDQIIDILVRRCPPGAQIDVMGVQNIKGTGLDFVYRWVSLDTVKRALRKCGAENAEECEEGLRELLAHDDYGLVDSTHALAAIEELRMRAAPDARAAFDPVIARLASIAPRRRAGLASRSQRTLGDLLRGFVGKTFDYLHSVRRQRRASSVIEDLVAGRISHAAAAVEMRAIVAHAKGAWALQHSKG
jgi:hypothetical protein